MTPRLSAASVAGRTAYRILPVCLVLDAATPGAPRTPAVADVLPLLRDALAVHPTLSDKLRLAVVDIADDAEVRLALTDPLDPQLVVPAPPLRHGAPSGAALVTVRHQLDLDVARLEDEGFLVHHPLVWMILGQVTDDDSWRSGVTDLSAAPAAPTIVPCCFGPADRDAVRTAIHPATGPDTSTMYAVDPVVPAVPAVAALTQVFATTLVRTGHGLGATDRRLALPADDELPRRVSALGRLPPPPRHADDGSQADQDATAPR